MAKLNNQFEKDARLAAERLDRARAAGEQLTFLPDEEPAADLPAKAGRPEGSKNKVSNQMREFLAAKGYDMPENMLAQMAGLASREDAILTAMQAAERILAWAADGSTRRRNVGTKAKPKYESEPWEASAEHRLSVFMQVYTIQLRAADALLPYGAAKVTPDVTNNNLVIPIMQMPAPSRPGDNARVIEGRSGGKSAPPPMPQESKQKQEVNNPVGRGSDGESRTE